jgi:folate-dependent phosphoribosylglycinamide formyltransferase PurN
MTQMTENLFDTYCQRPTVALFMSGGGSNAQAILSDPELPELYEITTIVTDNPTSNAAHIARANHLELLDRPARAFHQPNERAEYFDALAQQLKAGRVQAIFYAGFMKIVTPVFAELFPGINVHPADLSIKDSGGLARYRGMDAMQQMIKELGYVRSTAHVVDTPFDCGSAISLSEMVVPDQTMPDSELHQLLKPKEHKLYTQTLKLLGRGLIRTSDIPISLFTEDS